MSLNLALVITGEAGSAKKALAETKAELAGVAQANDAVAASAGRARDASGRFIAGAKGATDAGRQVGDALKGGSEEAAKGLGLARHEVTNLSAQLADLGVQIAGGGSPLMAMIQQGPQIADVLGGRGLTGIIAGVGQGIASLVNPVTITLAAVTGLGYAASWAFDMIRGEVKSTDQVLEEHEAFIKRVGEAYPEAAKKAASYAADSAQVLRALGADRIEDQVKALQGELSGVAATYDSIINPIARPEALMTFPDFAPFVGVLERISEEAGKARPEVAGIREEIAKIRNDPGQSDGVKAVASELLAATEGANALSAALPATTKLVESIGGVADRSAERLKLLHETAMGFADAMERLGAGDQPQLSAREQALQDYIKAAGQALDARDGQNARAAYDARIKRIEAAEAGAGVPLPTSRPNDIQRLDDAAAAEKRGATPEERQAQKTDAALARQRDRIALLSAEVGAMDQGTDARAALIASLETEQEIRRLGIDAQSDEARAMRANGAEIVRLTQERARGVAAAREAEKKWSENRDLAKGLLTDLTGTLRDTTAGWQGMADAALRSLDRIMDRLINSGIDALLDQWLPKPGGGSAGAGSADKWGGLRDVLLGKAANDNANYAPGAVTRAPLGPAGGAYGTDMAGNIRQLASNIGADPTDLATLMSFESGLRPGAWGGTGGRHYGLIQAGAAERAAYGITPGGTLAGQFGGIERFFKDRGFKPGMSGLDLYSTVNAGSPGRYNASDTANGGTWGTVADKWNLQMGDHRKVAQELLGSSETAKQALDNLATGSTSATEGLGTFAGGLGKMGDALGRFPAAPAAGGGGGLFSWLGGLFGGGSGLSPAATAVIAGGGVGLYAEGGWTGPGGKWEPRGIAHADEYIFSAAATRAIGVGNLDKLHRSAKNGFAEGGYAGPESSFPSRGASGGGGWGGAGRMPEIRFVNNGTPQKVVEQREEDDGQGGRRWIAVLDDQTSGMIAERGTKSNRQLRRMGLSNPMVGR